MYDTPAARNGFIERRVHGWLTAAEGEALYETVGHLTVPEGETYAAVELGAWHGRSTCYLGWGALDNGRVTVYSVDHHQGSPEHYRMGLIKPGESTYETFSANIEAAGVLDVVVPLLLSSDAASALANGLDPVGLLFIDADHTEDAVRQDYTLWSPHVVSGGWIALHDVNAPDWPGPTAVAAELRKLPWRTIKEVDNLLLLQKP